MGKTIQKLKLCVCNKLICDDCLMILAGNPSQCCQLSLKPKGNSYRLKSHSANLLLVSLLLRHPQMRTRGFGLRADEHFNFQHLRDPAPHQPHLVSAKSGGNKTSWLGVQNPSVEDGFVACSPKMMKDQDGYQ